MAKRMRGGELADSDIHTPLAMPLSRFEFIDESSLSNRDTVTTG